jgi:hypothetical protein
MVIDQAIAISGSFETKVVETRTRRLSGTLSWGRVRQKTSGTIAS